MGHAAFLAPYTSTSVASISMVTGPAASSAARSAGSRPAAKSKKNGSSRAPAFGSVNRDLEIRDLYNAEDGFSLGQAYARAYRSRLNANLAFYDRLNGKVDWPLDDRGVHPLTELLLADFLVVDISKPFSEDSGLEIERALLAGRAHATCGSRSSNDDIIDTLYTLMVAGVDGPRISDGVDQATRSASRSFPYLVSPNPRPPDRTAILAALSGPPE